MGIVLEDSRGRVRSDNDPDPRRAPGARSIAMMTMGKIDIAAIEGRLSPGGGDVCFRSVGIINCLAADAAQRRRFTCQAPSDSTVSVPPSEGCIRAFLDADAKAKWLPAERLRRQGSQLRRRVGGHVPHVVSPLRQRLTQLLGGTYTELVPRRENIKYTDKFENPNIPGEMHVTSHVRKVSWHGVNISRGHPGT